MPGKHLVLRGDARRIPLADGAVDEIICSPPYFAQRSYRDGGAHFDGQIGSEPHPRQWLEAMFEVMKECWRVLAPSGSCFVNLGDKRSGSGGPGGDYNPGGLRDGQPRAKRAMARPSRWSREDAAWLAGVIDCDGSISVKVNSVDRPSPYYVGWMRVGQMRPEVVHRCAVVTGVGQVFQDKRGVWNWNVAAQQARYILERIWPWLRIKQAQALAVIELQRHIEQHDGENGRATARAPEAMQYRQMIRDAVVGWNKGLECDWLPPYSRPIELPERPELGRRKSRQLLPERFAIGCEDGLADPEGIGWIVRNVIIWEKVNGLPESVNDRTRDNFEYLYHLTKSERYFAAVDEIREPLAAKTLTHRGGGKAWGNDENPDNNWGDGGERRPDPRGALPGSVWRIASEPLRIPDWAKERYNLPDHFAAFGTEIPRRLILGFSPSGICTACGEPCRPVVERTTPVYVSNASTGAADERKVGASSALRIRGGGPTWNRLKAENPDTITGYACRCTPYTNHSATPRKGPRNTKGWAAGTGDRDCPSGGYGGPNAYEKTGAWREYHFAGWTPPPTRNAVVLDVFGGTGTTALVAETLGRTGISLDLSADYCNLARWRIEESQHGRKAEQRTWAEAQGILF